MHDGPWRQKKISWELHASAAFSLSKNPSVVWVQNSLSHVVSVRKNDAARKKMQLRLWPGTVLAGLHQLGIFRYVINLSEAEIYLGKLRKADSTEKREQLTIILFSPRQIGISLCFTATKP